MTRLILLSTVLTFFFSLQSQAVTYRTCAQDFYPKFYLQDREMSGYSVDIIKALQRIDKNIHFEGFEIFCTIPRIEADLLSGRQDVFIAAFKTPKREESFYFLDVPLYVLKYVMVIRKADPVKTSSFEDIRKLGKDGIILTLFGTGLESFLQQQQDLQIESSAPTIEANLRMLEKGRGRFFFTVDLGVEALLNKPPWKNKFTILPTVFGEKPQFIMISKKMPAKDMTTLLAATKRLRSNGELERIFQAYKKEVIDSSPVRH